MDIQENEQTKVSNVKNDSETASAKNIVAEGFGQYAKRILQEARKHNIQTLLDEDMLNKLNRLDLSEEIPPELQPAIEEILKYLNKMDLPKGTDSQ
jgi:flagellar biosynthesis protein